MTSISATFKRLRDRRGKAFIPYTMAGYPSISKTVDTVKLFEDCGADIIELGVPFSDPLADGPAIQKASESALSNGVHLNKVLELVNDLRETTRIPIVLMTYFNPVFRYGIGKFAHDAAAAKVDGMIVPDLPPDEADEFIGVCRKVSVDTIFLLAPTSTSERIKKVAKASSGFIYYVSITGITGSKLLFDGTMESLIGNIRKHTDKPVAVGFGVSSPEEAAAVAAAGDGVIVGSAIVKRLHEHREQLEQYLSNLRRAIPHQG